MKRTPPTWLHLPAMMRVVLSTPFVFERLNQRTRPYNFLFCPPIDVTLGYPQGVDRARFTLIAAFTKDRDAWLTLPRIDVADGTNMSCRWRMTRELPVPLPGSY